MAIPVAPSPAPVEPPSPPAYWEARADVRPSGRPADLAGGGSDLDRIEDLARSFVGLAELRRTVCDTPSALLGRIVAQGVEHRIEGLSRFLAGQMRGDDASDSRSDELQHALLIIEWLLDTAGSAEEFSTDLGSLKGSLDALRARLAA